MSEPVNRSTEEIVAEECYVEYLDSTGDFTSRKWDDLSVSERETWRRVVRVAWGRNHLPQEGERMTPDAARGPDDPWEGM